MRDDGSAALLDNIPGSEIMVAIITIAKRCIGCGICSEQCPQQALTLSPDAILRDKTLCNGCGNCIEVCPASVHETTG